MFPAIDIERARDKMSIRKLAEKSGIKYDTLLNKLNGRREFTRNEMLSVQKSFSHLVPLEMLFEIAPHPGQ